MTALPAVAPDPPAGPDAGGGLGRRATFRRGWDVFAENRLALACLGLLVLIAAFCFLGPLIYHSNQYVFDVGRITAPPGPGRPLGTDQDGEDQLGKLMAGGQTSLEVGLAAGIMASVIGSLYGAVAGYVGGWVDAAMMRCIDALLCVPLLFGLIYLNTVFGRSKTTMILELGLTSWFAITRLVRGESLSIRVRDYVAACRMMGGGGARIVLRHILPNTVGTIVVSATFIIADAIFALSTLSYLGLGLQSPHADWGGMLNIGTQYAAQGYWWLIYPPGVAIVLVIVSLNVIGDALRDSFETRLRQR